MIEIVIKTDGNEIFDSYKEDQPTMKEVALILYKMETIRKELLEKEFPSSLEVSDDIGGEDDENI